MKIKNGEIPEAQESLCCNYAAFQDGSFTCDLMLGDSVISQPENSTIYDFVATYTFGTSENIGSEEKEEGSSNVIISFLN